QGPYYLRAFLDLNGNGNLDPGEPFEIFNGKRAGQAPDPIMASTTQASVNILVTDDNLTPPPACLGDCNGDRRVTTGELIILIDFALDVDTDLAACPNGLPADITSASQVTIGRILQAVHNAVNGC